MSNTKFWKGVLLGAVAGGIVSLLDRNTRETVFENLRGASDTIAYYAKHPQEGVRCVKDSTRKIRSTIEEVSEEISYIAEKVDELREITPQVTGIIMDSKEVLLDNRADNKNHII